MKLTYFAHEMFNLNNLLKDNFGNNYRQIFSGISLSRSIYQIIEDLYPNIRKKLLR